MNGYIKILLVIALIFYSICVWNQGAGQEYLGFKIIVWMFASAFILGSLGTESRKE